MATILESFFTGSKHFSVHRRSIQILFYSDPGFRETCKDYHKCSKALRYWSNSQSQEASFRKEEYSVLLQELKQELLQCISLFDEKTVSNLQNKGKNNQ